MQREFRRIAGRLDKAGTWQISCVGVNPSSMERILTVERASWKNDWRAQKHLQEDSSLWSILRGCQKNCVPEPFFESEIWFLELNGLTIAYQLVLTCKETAVLAKTSYDSRFKKLSLIKYLINTVIQQTFRKLGKLLLLQTLELSF